MENYREKERSGTARIVFIIILLLLAVFSGVLWFFFRQKPAEVQFKQLNVVSGADKCVFPKERFNIIVQAVDEEQSPMAGREIAVAADNSVVAVSPAKVTTDAGGNAKFTVIAGRKLGDNYIGFRDVQSGREISVRFANGIKVLGGGQEGNAGEILAREVGVKLVDADGSPRSGVNVFITSAQAVPEQEVVTTNIKGEALTKVKLPDVSGVSTVNFSVDPRLADYRPVSEKVFSFDPVNVIIAVLGGLAIFMLGMTMMSDGLANIAGEKMKSILGYCTSNRVVALLAGAGITAVIQSSSATTVMVIGFVNAGLINLYQSIGVIFGANIGTTITAQIIAFDVGVVALPAVIAGVVMRFIKRGKMPEIGGTVMGFGLLFFGMNLMSAELKAISSFPSFLKFFQFFDCQPVDGIIPYGNLMGTLLIGLLATLVVQSSSATTGVVIALGAGGLINLYTGVVLILGANIGTTITAQLAAIPANRPARQAALAHTLFNVIGVVIVIATFWIPWGKSRIPAFFYLVNAVTDGNAFAVTPENMARHIANAHTMFNIATALLLLPFTRVLVFICEKLMPVKENKVHFQYLEPHLLDSPSLALRQSITALGKMLKKSWKMVDSAVCCNFIPGKVDTKNLEKFNSREERVDRYQSEIMEYLSQIMRRKISPKQAELIPLLMHCANDAERIADRAENIINLTRRMEEEDLILSRPAVSELEEIFRELNNQTRCAISALEKGDVEYSERAVRLEKSINRLAGDSESAHVKRMKSGKCTAKTGIIYVELLSELVAVSRHLSNIAERAVTT